MAIYLDHAATTPLRPEALEAMLPYLGGSFGNPSSAHSFGRVARNALDEALDALELAAGFLEDSLPPFIKYAGTLATLQAIVTAVTGT